MPSKDFVQSMQTSLDSQQQNRELAANVALHDADVRKLKGTQNWEILREEVKTAISQIGRDSLSYEEKEGSGFAIANLGELRTVTVSFDQSAGTITYEGTTVGRFQAQVSGNELTYHQIQTTRTADIDLHLSHIGQRSTIEQIADFLISAVVNG